MEIYRTTTESYFANIFVSRQITNISHKIWLIIIICSYTYYDVPGLSTKEDRYSIRTKTTHHSILGA